MRYPRIIVVFSCAILSIFVTFLSDYLSLPDVHLVEAALTFELSLAETITHMRFHMAFYHLIKLFINLGVPGFYAIQLIFALFLFWGAMFVFKYLLVLKLPPIESILLFIAYFTFAPVLITNLLSKEDNVSFHFVYLILCFIFLLEKDLILRFLKMAVVLSFSAWIYSGLVWYSSVSMLFLFFSYQKFPLRFWYFLLFSFLPIFVNELGALFFPGSASFFLQKSINELYFFGGEKVSWFMIHRMKIGFFGSFGNSSILSGFFLLHLGLLFYAGIKLWRQDRLNILFFSLLCVLGFLHANSQFANVSFKWTSFYIFVWVFTCYLIAQIESRLRTLLLFNAAVLSISSISVFFLAPDSMVRLQSNCQAKLYSSWTKERISLDTKKFDSYYFPEKYLLIANVIAFRYPVLVGKFFFTDDFKRVYASPLVGFIHQRKIRKSWHTSQLWAPNQIDIGLTEKAFRNPYVIQNLLVKDRSKENSYFSPYIEKNLDFCG